jgi:hypothetical protein
MTDSTDPTEVFISKIDQATSTLGTLRALDVEIHAARIDRDGNGRTDDDAFPEREMTYGEYIAAQEQKKRAIIEANADHMDVVRKIQAKNEAEQIASLGLTD